MQKSSASTIMLALASLILSSCEKSDLTAPVQEAQPLFTELSVSMPQTKTTYTEGEDGLAVSWKAGDKMTLLAFSNDNAYYLDGSKAEFTAQNDGSASVFTGSYTFTGEADKYMCFYPAMDISAESGYASENGVLTRLSPTHNTFSMNLRDNYQTASGNADHLKYTDIMTGEFTVKDGKATATLSKQTAILKLVLSNAKGFSARTYNPAYPYHIYSVSLDCADNTFYDSNLSYSFINFKTIYSSMTKNLFSNFHNDFEPVDGAYILYIPVIPFELKKDSTLNINLTFEWSEGGEGTEDYVLYKGAITIPQDYSMEAGKIYTITKDLTNSWYDNK